MPYELTSPLTSKELARLDDRPQMVQFSQALSESDYRRLGEWVQGRPHVTVRAYGWWATDLDWLRWLPDLKRFRVDGYQLDDFGGLRHLPDDLVALGLGATKKRLSLAPVERFTGLRHLFLEGHSKSIDVVSRLTRLTDLVLRSITLPNLDLLLPLEELRALDLKLGGTTNLAALPAIGRIQYLELWQVRGLTDLSPVSQMKDLEFLFLQTLSRVTVLPDFSDSQALTHIWLETMKGLTDLSSLTTAPNLAHLALVDMTRLSPDAVAPLVGCPALTSVRVGLGSNTKNHRVHELLGSLAATEGWDDFDSSHYRFR